jgi:hypothetical protein
MSENEVKEVLGRFVAPVESWQAEREVKDAQVIANVTARGNEA